MINPVHVSVDAEAQCIHPSPFRIPAHNLLAGAEDASYDTELAKCESLGGKDASFLAITWNVEDNSGYSFWPIWGADTGRELALHAFVPQFEDADDGELSLAAEVDCQLLKVRLDFEAQPNFSLASGDLGGTSSTPTVRPSLSFQVAVGEGDDRKWYKVLVNGSEMFMVFSRLDSEEDWTAVQSSPRPKLAGLAAAASFYKNPSYEPIDAEVKLIGGKLAIRLGSTPVVLDEARQTDDGDPITTITALKIESHKALNLFIQCSQVYFNCVMTYQSPEINTGFSSTTWAGLEMRYATGDAGWFADLDTPVEEMEGPIVSYKATWTGPVDGTFKGESWSKHAPAIRAVLLTWDGVEDYMPEAPVELDPASWCVEHTFDPGGLTIESAAEIGFSSNKSQLLPSGTTGTWGQWIIDTGQFAILLDGGRTLPDGSWPGNERLFTGYGNTSAAIHGQAGNAGAKLRCNGRNRQLMSMVPYLPWMDAWNVFYAIFFLAQMRGVSPDDMAFLGSVPESPFDDSLDEDGAGAWFLPVGAANSVLVRPNLGEPVWFKMRRIAREAGYLLYFDLYGKLQFRKFKLPSAEIKRSFFESDAESYAQPSGGLEGCVEVTVQKNMDQVRSQLVLMGPSPFEGKNQGTVTVVTDSDVLDDGDAFNHLGYKNEAIWIDTQFSAPDYATEAASKIFATLRTPLLAATFRTWFQPDIYPLDVISLESTKFGTSAIPLLVLGVRHESGPGGPAYSTITAMHYVPE